MLYNEQNGLKIREVYKGGTGMIKSSLRRTLCIFMLVIFLLSLSMLLINRNDIFVNENIEISSSIQDYNGLPTLFINGEAQPALAYMTYFQENNEYDSFSEAGYQLFSLPVYFSTRGINTLSNIGPFEEGVFEVKGEANFEVFEQNIQTILENNPNAYILPRVNISMPKWWEEENPTEVNVLADGQTMRESFYSQKWREDAGKFLLQFIEHINQSTYRDRILGYQIACGNTEEWFHFDLNGGIGPAAEKGFEAFIAEVYPDEVGDYEGLPHFQYEEGSMITDDLHTIRFLEFCSLSVADAISYFANLVKEATNHQLIVGTFYGYSLEVSNPLYGTHALNYLLDNPNIDFLCSPNSYLLQRAAGIDWPDMSVTDSIKLHNKLYFAECDVRTSLTEGINESRPKTAQEGTYNSGLWFGPSTVEESLALIRKTFARQLIKGNGLWWFDMWGGWFEDGTIMKEIATYKTIASQALQDEKRESIAQVAVFVDEASYKYLNPESTLNTLVSKARLPLGLVGVPYDIYDVNDFEQVYDNYDAITFLTPVITERIKTVIEIAEIKQLPVLSVTEQQPELTPQQLREFYEKSGIHIWCESDDVIYVNENFIAIHASTSGTKTLNLGRPRKVIPLLPQLEESFVTDTIKIEMNQYETRLFRLEN